MKRDGFLTLTLRSGVEAAVVPAHLDCLSGAGRPTARLDGGRIDALVSRWADGARYRRIFHARRSLGRPGEHHVGFADDEEALGMSRSYQVELGRPEAASNLREALRDLGPVEQCDEQTLACAPFDLAPTGRRLSYEQALQAQRRIRAPEALAREPGDATITVAVVDTGVVVGHPELQRRCMAGYDTVDLGLGRLNDSTRLIGDSRGWDYNPYDEVGHGCLVAGIIGARGFRLPRGLAGLAMLLPIRVLAAARREAAGARLVGVGALPDIDAGIKVAVDLGATVINMSLGSPRDERDVHAAPPHRAVARYALAHGCVLVAAAGNSGQRQQFYPAALPEVIAVGSVDAQGQRSRFSTWGSHIALCAPGESIVGVGRRGYQASSGTSFASPYVAGAAALLMARARRRGQALDAGGVRQLLCSSAQRLPGPAEEVGAGLLDCSAALDALDALHATTPSRR
ncbi:S8 family peptidase [Methylibium rhizosphaerae]|uniref:S8 family peptidase n=1 Tax=Methylibium rhizosphaerae TaxID=2570323 RepID=UPI00112780C6|nr:S8 family serine peptidase [Methylibium rhizosphaerae]